METKKTTLTSEQKTSIIDILHSRFMENIFRHEDLHWNVIEKRLDQYPEKLFSISAMERTGGEPDVIGYDETSDVYIFVDCSAESPIGRRSLCYDQVALENRKKNPPTGSAGSLAVEMGIEMLDEEQYRNLQKLGVFDVKSSSWIRTPESMRALGGALFGDCRYDRVFIYHNGADSYYASRGFRGLLRV
nr:DUF4256 domain-containing protein [uncultured Sphaerochaeta sp.]